MTWGEAWSYFLTNLPGVLIRSLVIGVPVTFVCGLLGAFWELFWVTSAGEALQARLDPLGKGLVAFRGRLDPVIVGPNPARPYWRRAMWTLLAAELLLAAGIVAFILIAVWWEKAHGRA